MSRAFVKEPEGDQAEGEPIERPQSEHPNYISRAGLERVQSRVEQLRGRMGALDERKDDLGVKAELASLSAEFNYLQKRVQNAIPVDVGAQDGDKIRFGATVEMVDEKDQRYVFTIVGEDEADAARNLISWVSPLGRELLDKQAGDTVIWRRPAGDLELDILSFRYGAES